MPKKKAVKKRRKTESLKQTDAMVREDKFQPSTLEQAWGDDGTSKYKTLNLDVYEQVLRNMSKADLKNEAVRVGLLPVDNMDQLRIRLIREFNGHVASYKKPESPSNPSIDDPNLDPNIRKILGEGR
jgi:hypothetical protein